MTLADGGSPFVPWASPHSSPPTYSLLLAGLVASVNYIPRLGFSRN